MRLCSAVSILKRRMWSSLGKLLGSNQFNGSCVKYAWKVAPRAIQCKHFVDRRIRAVSFECDRWEWVNCVFYIDMCVLSSHWSDGRGWTVNLTLKLLRYKYFGTISSSIKHVFSENHNFLYPENGICSSLKFKKKLSNLCNFEKTLICWALCENNLFHSCK